LLGDVQKIVVRPGQTLSEIAAQLAPQLDGATLDQAMLALFKANPDAFASGSINRLEAGAELNKPNQALLRSISPAEASQFVAESNAQWRAERDAKAGLPNNAGASKESVEAASKDRLKIGSSADGNAEERRFAEDLVAQERALEQTRAKVAELEKNIADLQALLDKAKGKAVTQPAPSSDAGYASYTPAAFALLLIALTGFLLWILAKNARRSEVHDFSKSAPNIPPVHKERVSAQSAMPERAKALFAGIDLDLSPAKTTNKTDSIVENPLADALRVKLNLARAYVTIEDFAAAKKSLQEIINIGGPIDPVVTVEAQGLLLELSQRDS
jgi:pilus assembly protein FimV